MKGNYQPKTNDWVSHDAGPGRYFVVYNDNDLTDEMISDKDIQPIQVNPANRESAEAWSADLDWYFKVTEAGIILARPGAKEGVICLKRSWRFIEAFIEAPHPARRQKR
jgi:hypothetical protein